ncbi:hypothetical protein U9R62_02905 [Cylindrospermopsis raciborskii DSH]|uniref:cell envelope integrity protein TolA n=1 Tax=Cylindrospermopsis raciborskii TaxID=77022 RepID=UPI001FD14008|nr:cell envelope integrity protein TolA [Cylindrospermopsis raciborskii]
MLDSLTVKNLSPKSQRVMDSPGLWTLAFLGSISLHVLLFWWLSSSKLFGFWVPPSQSGQDNVVVELVDIPASVEPQKQVPKSEPALAKPNPSPSTPKQANYNTTKKVAEQVVVAKPINSNLNRSPVTPPRQNQPNTPLIPKPTPGKFLLPPKSSPPPNDLPWNSPREEVKVESEKSNPLPEIAPDKLPKPISSPSLSENPTPETTPVGENSQPQLFPQLFTLTIEPLNRDEIQELRKQDLIAGDIPPDVLPKYQGSSTKELTITFSSAQTQPSKRITILVSLIVNQHGKLEQVFIIDPNISEKDQSVYEPPLRELFQQEKFVGGYDKNGSQPEKSNLYLRVTIVPRDSPTSSPKNSP